MTIIPEPEEIRARVRAAGSSVPALCAAAGLHRSIFDRWLWRRGTPTLARARRLVAALERIEAEAAADRPAGAARARGGEAA